MKPLNKVKIKWSPKFAYIIGLLATDGNLSKDRRHINFTSKDIDLVKIFKEALCVDCLIGKKSRSSESDKKYYYIQFSDVIFYKFLESIGLFANKSKTINDLKIPQKFYYHFLRGCFDGDGNVCEFKHPESKNVQLKLRLISASKDFLEWIHSVTSKSGINGYINKNKRVYVLCYGKTSSIKLINLLYYNTDGRCLKRKYAIVKKYIYSAGVV